MTHLCFICHQPRTAEQEVCGQCSAVLDESAGRLVQGLRAIAARPVATIMATVSPIDPNRVDVEISFAGEDPPHE